ncbi:MAG: hypothetical protein HYZ12_06050, partial [Thaumarchaeota archaeon]|nr:hypothetical protein [Nitrososphaerota archaeon]
LGALLSSWKGEKARRGSIFVGAGDSYAAALCASYLSCLSTQAVDPYVLHESPDMARGKDVYFISVSGRTRANIATAKTISRICRSSVAITANQEGPLASEVDRVIVMPYTGAPKLPGTLSFSFSLLTALLLALPSVDCDFKTIFSKSRPAARKFKISDLGVTYVLGNGAAYGVSLYATAKLNELLGGRSHPELLEEFSHMELFSLSRSDTVNVFPQFDSKKLASRLCKSLHRDGYTGVSLQAWGRNDIERIFHSVFLVQQGVIEAAMKRGLIRPYFLDAEKLLKTSDAMIY